MRIRPAEGATRAMDIYDKFAHFYAKGDYPEFSQAVVAFLPNVFERFGVHPSTVLDLACGEGAFAVAMAGQGFAVTGVDQSPAMLELARSRAANENVDVQFLRQDIRTLSFDGQFDVVTCWNDSLNYMLDLEDLEQTFAGASRALKQGGLFLFDMNTFYGLSHFWQRPTAYVQQDSEDVFEVHRTSYDAQKKIATLKITGFKREGDGWSRMDEEHKERGYTLEEIESGLDQAGFRKLATWGSLGEMADLTPKSPRVWIVAAKQA